MAKKRILIVEDDENMREIYQDMFTGDEDYEIEQVNNGEAGLVCLEKKAYDLVILDIIMEKLPGDSFFIRARDNPKTAELPILIVSVLNPEILVKLKELDHCRIVQKPATKAQIKGEIKKLIG